MCETYRIPHSHFLGGPLRWTSLDRQKAQAYSEWKAKACSGCGTRSEDWDPSLGGDRFAYVSHTERCPGCELKEMERENVPEHAKGIRIGLIPNPALFDLDDEEAAA